MDLTLEKALDLFLLDQEIKGHSQATIVFYKSNVNYFINFFGENRDVSEITMDSINEWTLMLRKRDKMSTHPFRHTVNKPIEKISVQTYQRAVKGFVNWLYREQYIKENPVENWQLIKAEKKVIIPLSDEEIRTIVDHYNEKCELGLRNKCFILLMLDCGLRLDEVTKLKVTDVIFDNNYIKVFGKGSKERIVSIGRRTKKCLYNYLVLYRKIPAVPTDVFFMTKERLPITKDSIKQVISRLKKRLGIPRLKPHLLRHTFATLYIVNGGDLESLRILLGHTNIVTTQKYLHLANTYFIVNNPNTSSLIDKIYSRRLSKQK